MAASLLMAPSAAAARDVFIVASTTSSAYLADADEIRRLTPTSVAMPVTVISPGGRTRVGRGYERLVMEVDCQGLRVRGTNLEVRDLEGRPLVPAGPVQTAWRQLSAGNPLIRFACGEAVQRRSFTRLGDPPDHELVALVLASPWPAAAP